MEFDSLVSEIVARVAKKLSESENVPVRKPGILVLTSDHGNSCHKILENKDLSEHYTLDCAILKGDTCNLDQYETVFLFDLSNDSLGKLTAGICDSPYISLAVKAVLSGKKIYIPEEEIELYKYKMTAPRAYYEMMEAKLSLLQASGVTILPVDKLAEAILLGNKEPNTCPTPFCMEKKSVLDKRVITEKDIISAHSDGITQIHVCEHAIITDLAKDYASSRKIVVIRDDTTGRKQGRGL